jgi:hypothetical protein
VNKPVKIRKKQEIAADTKPTRHSCVRPLLTPVEGFRPATLAPFDYCWTTICDVLVTFRVRLSTNGIERGNAYVTTTFTMFPGALQVPELQAVQVVDVPDVPVVVAAVSHDVVTVMLAALTAMNLRPFT